MGRQQRLVSLAVAVSVASVVTPAAAYAATPKTVKLSASIVYREIEAWKTDKDPGRCVVVPFVLFAEVRGAVRYAVQVDGLNGSGDVVGGGPPFPHDRYSLTGAPGKTVTLVVPGGSHWFPLGWYSTGQGCGVAKSVSQGRWVIASATVTIDPDFVRPPPHRRSLPSRGGTKTTVYVTIPSLVGLSVSWTGPNPTVVVDGKQAGISRDSDRPKFFHRTMTQWHTATIRTGPNTTLRILDNGDPVLVIRPNTTVLIRETPHSNVLINEPMFTDKRGTPLKNQ